ncbi:DUF6531 domain-containing protein [Pseudomonas sp. RA_105y_Pfl2_P56]|uniref:DUF6531 domain-containing protein n=1 Tax=Pseudomonas sp. RA_105y_Pfl2_P56 TaxID=3088701 RepID=UPI0030D9168B
MLSKLLASYASLLIISITSPKTLAEEYYWNIQPEAYDWVQKKHSSPELACRALHTDTEYGEYEYNAATPTPSENQWTCNLLYGNDPEEDNIPLSIHRYGKACAQNKSFNALNGQCEIQASDNNICIPQTVGNPINFLTGYKIQSEQDFPPSTTNAKNKLKFIKHYNSASGLWTHSFSTRILINDKTITLVHPNGERSFFDKKETDYVARHPSTGTISNKTNSWILVSKDNSKTKFDSTGRLLDFQSRDVNYFISYINNLIKISDGAGNFLELTEDRKNQPLKLKATNT